MRINTGKYKSKQLAALKSNVTRPTTDKVRESIFDVIRSLRGINGSVLDLFAGSGALGIEALSRGCESSVFIEKNPNAFRVLKSNLSFVKEHVEVYNTDWKVAVRKLEGRKFDLIFVDPPYALRIEKDVIREIISKNILKRDGVLVIEHATDNVIDFDNSIFEVMEKVYSGTTVSFLKYREDVSCVFPGSFNPITLGHCDVIESALKDFAKVIVAVSEITYKEDVLPRAVRYELCKKALAEYGDRVSVVSFDGMLTDFLSGIGCRTIVRGYRNADDYKYERKLEKIYLGMDPGINYVLYESNIPEIASSVVRTSEKERLETMIPGSIVDDYLKIRGKKATK